MDVDDEVWSALNNLQINYRVIWRCRFFMTHTRQATVGRLYTLFVVCVIAHSSHLFVFLLCPAVKPFSTWISHCRLVIFLLARVHRTLRYLLKDEINSFSISIWMKLYRYVWCVRDCACFCLPSFLYNLFINYTPKNMKLQFRVELLKRNHTHAKSGRQLCKSKPHSRI